jgi:hypothetical protein
MRKCHPDLSSVHQEFDIHGIGVAGGNGHDHGLIDTMDLLLSPAISRSEIFKHVLIKTIAERMLCGQTARGRNFRSE